MTIEVLAAVILAVLLTSLYINYQLDALIITYS